MKVIRFPGKEAIGSKSTDPTQKLYIGPISFTCMECGTVTEAHFNKMVFRTIELYCAECGTFYKLTNPAFGAPKTSK